MDASYRTLAGAAELGEFTVRLLAEHADVKQATVRTVLNRHRRLFEQAAGVSARRGGQTLVWSVCESTRAELEATIATMGAGFRDGPDAGSALRLRAPAVNPELATADDLNSYPQQHERAAQELLPHLVRRLLAATSGVTSVSMRTGDGISLPGLDGRAEGTVTSQYVPPGHSAWELGTSGEPRKKAQGDHKNRTPKIPVAERAETTFVAASMRRFRDKEDWAAARRADGAWRDVRALDADDLHGWLEEAPAVHVWVSEQMGLHPLEVRTLDQWWQSWSGQTRPTVPAKLLLAGRGGEAQELIASLRRVAQVVGLYGGSREEAIAFAAAALVGPDERDDQRSVRDPLARTLLVLTPQQWTRLAGTSSPLVLIPGFDQPDVAAAIRAGHSVLTPMGSGDDRGRATILLPRLARDAARDALRRPDWDLEQADRNAGLARRSLTSFRRMLAVAPVYTRPPWALPPSSGVLAPLVLVGGWSAGSTSDQEIVAAITGRQYADVERELRTWAASDDSPFLLSGGNWQLSAPQDAWSQLHHALTAADLARWQDSAAQVLAEPDPALDLPPHERLFAGARHVMRRCSSALRAGLARGAALLGAAEDVRLPDNRTCGEHAESLVSELLLHGPPGDSRWASLADVLPLLAEAAPETFLRAATAGCSGSEPMLRGMFADGDTDAGWGATSPHTGLLWAIESLCWPAEWASEACELLGRLAEIDPGGRLANRPMRSLHHVLLPQYPQTAATAETRLEIISSLVERRPRIGWPLLLSLLPQYFDISEPTHSPFFRDDWKPAASTLTFPDLLAATHGLVAVALQALQDEPERWAEFIGGAANLPSAELSRCLDELAAIDPDTVGQSARLAVWTALTETVTQHRGSPGATWALAEPILGRIEQITVKWQPATMERHARLFNWHPDLPGTDSYGPAYDQALSDARQVAIRQAIAIGEPAAWNRLIARSPLPRLVGATLAEVAGESQAEAMLAALGESGPAQQVAIGWLIRMGDLRGADWIDWALRQAGELPGRARMELHLALPPVPALWAAVAADTPEVSASYWRRVSGLLVAADDVPAFVTHLLAHHRPWSAIDLLTMRNGQAPPTLIEQVLRGAGAPDVDESPRPGSAEYAVGVLLDRLEANGASDQTMFDLEWQFFSFLEHRRAPQVIYKALSQEPGFFADLVCAAFRAKGEPKTQLDAAATARTRQSHALLRQWRRPPGCDGDGTIDEGLLRPWINRARRLLADKGRSQIGDECLGQVLSASPPGSDGIWPALPIREIIEELASSHFTQGIAIGKFNARGMTTRGAFDGGQQEDALANQYEAWSRHVMVRWPETGRMLREMAGNYRTWARRFDDDAERWADSS